MASEQVSSKFKGLKINDTQEINILLLGETGVGKSTFINSIANYFHFKSFKKAAKREELLFLIPTVFDVTDKDGKRINIKVGSDNNEYQEVGAAGTQGVKTYVFPLGEGKTKLRLIDSPGMGDPRGIEQDDVNCENILAYLSQLHDLHAICFLMKPTTTRITVYFEYCVKQILSRLEKSASKNIIFIFTNSRGTNYTPGDTFSSLNVILNNIKSKPPHVNIPLTNDNAFSVDNEAFRYLAALRQNVKFNKKVEAQFVESWNNSSKECWRLISYILGDDSRYGLLPHQLANTISINEARRMIVQLSQPMADISQLIDDNVRILNRHEADLATENQSLDELKKKLYIPVINLEVTQLMQPVTVCTSAKCADIIMVGNIKKWHYRQRCHDPCYLASVAKEIRGDPNLLNCTAMNGTRTCQKCRCDCQVHMHVYYLTKHVADKIIDENVKDNINQKEETLQISRRLINEIGERKRELKAERDKIIASTAQFTLFLQHNAISPYSDSHKAYIEYLIKREESLGKAAQEKTILNLKLQLKQYEEIKEAFEESLKMSKQLVPSTVTAESIISTVQQLYQLKHTGKKIHELITKQKKSRSSEFNETCEYIHPKSSEPLEAKEEKDDEQKSITKTTVQRLLSTITNAIGNWQYREEGVYQQANQAPPYLGHSEDYNGANANRDKELVHQETDPPPPYLGYSENYYGPNTNHQDEEKQLNELHHLERRQERSNEHNRARPNHPGPYPPYGPGPNHYYYPPPPANYYQGPRAYHYYQGPPDPYYSSPPANYYEGPRGYHYYQGPPDPYHSPPPAGYYHGPPRPLPNQCQCLSRHHNSGNANAGDNKQAKPFGSNCPHSPSPNVNWAPPNQYGHYGYPLPQHHEPYGTSNQYNQGQQNAEGGEENNDGKCKQPRNANAGDNKQAKPFGSNCPHSPSPNVNWAPPNQYGHYGYPLPQHHEPYGTSNQYNQGQQNAEGGEENNDGKCKQPRNANAGDNKQAKPFGSNCPHSPLPNAHWAPPTQCGQYGYPPSQHHGYPPQPQFGAAEQFYNLDEPNAARGEPSNTEKPIKHKKRNSM